MIDICAKPSLARRNIKSEIDRDISPMRVIACKGTSGITNLDPPWPLDRLPLLSSSSSSSSSLEVASDWGTEDGALLPESGPGPILEPEAPLQDGARPPSPCPSSFSARSTYNFTTNRNFKRKILMCV